MAAAQAWGANLTADGRTERVPALQVTGTLFDVLGAAPLVGRAIADADVTGDARVVVLAHRLWVRRFGSDAAVVGRPVVINGESYRVIGVMPPAFRFAPFWQTRAEAWVPLSLADRATDRGGRSLRVFARLRDGVSIDQARAELAGVNERLARDWPDTNTGLTTGAMLLQEKAVGPIRPLLLAVFGLAGGLLLVAAVNLTMLVVARMTSRQPRAGDSRGARRHRCTAAARRADRRALVVAVAGAVRRPGVRCCRDGRCWRARFPPTACRRTRRSPCRRRCWRLRWPSRRSPRGRGTLGPGWRLGRAAAAGALQPTRTVAGSRASTPGARGAGRRGGDPGVCARRRGDAVCAHASCTCSTSTSGSVPDRLVAVSVSLDGASQPSAEARTAFFSGSPTQHRGAARRVRCQRHQPPAARRRSLGARLRGRGPAAGRPGRGRRRRVSRGAAPLLRHGWPGAARRAATSPRPIARAACRWRSSTGTSPIGSGRAKARWAGGCVSATSAARSSASSPTSRRPRWSSPSKTRCICHSPSGRSQSATRSPMTLVVRTATDAPMFPALRDAVWALDRQAAVYDGMTLADVLAAETWRERLGARVGAIFAGVALLLAAVGIVERGALRRDAALARVRRAAGAGRHARARRHAGRSAKRRRRCVAGLVTGIVLVLIDGAAAVVAAGRRRAARPAHHRRGRPGACGRVGAGRVAAGGAGVARGSGGGAPRRLRRARVVVVTRDRGCRVRVRDMSKALVDRAAVLTRSPPCLPAGAGTLGHAGAGLHRSGTAREAGRRVRGDSRQHARGRQADRRAWTRVGRDHRRRTGGVRRRRPARRGGERSPRRRNRSSASPR